jgi:hypothetical protein
VSAACIGEPISWLELERFALGELAPAASDRVQRHLTGCLLCARCLADIRGPAQAAALPPLPARRPPRPDRAPVRPRWRRRWWTLTGAVAAAAATWLAVPALRPSGTQPKGIDVALTLVRERQGNVHEEPTGYLPEDRFKALVTCPPGRELAWALVLFQEGSPAAPVASGTNLICANRVPLPGAFRLTGTTRTAVCFVGLIGSAQAPSVEASDPSALEQAGAACIRLARDPG